VCGNSSNFLSLFPRNTSTGALSAVTNYAPGANTIANVVVSPDGLNVYITDEGNGKIWYYTRNISTGVLTGVSSAVLSGILQGLCISPDGLFVYTYNVNTYNFYQCSRSPSTGALTSLGSIVLLASGGSNGMIISPDGNFLYCIQGPTYVTSLARNQITGLLSSPVGNASYKQAGGNGRYLCVGDTSYYATVYGAETSTGAPGIGTQTGMFPNPSPNILYLWHSYMADTVPKPWLVVATETSIHLWVNINNETTIPNTTYGAGFFFGDIVSNLSGDNFNTMIMTSNVSANNSSGATTTALLNTSGMSNQVGHFIDRSFTGINQPAPVGKFIDRLSTTMNYPHIVDGTFILLPTGISEGIPGVVRGTMPGMWWPMSVTSAGSNSYMADGAQITFTSGDLSGKTFECRSSGTNVIYFYEISNTW
jgi:hypothetical protein